MSLSYTTVKVEPEYSFEVQLQHDEVKDDEPYPKQALDLSKKDTNSRSENDLNSLEMRPEFVNIKMEVDAFDDTVKEEQESELEEDSQPLSWYQPSTGESQPVNATNGQIFEVEIKQEPFEPGLECNSDGGQQFLMERSIQSQDSNEDDVSEEALRKNSTPDGKYMCPVCQNRFATKGLVQRHQMLHTKEKLQCNICFRDFIKISHLKKHVLSHSNVKSYDCQECGKQFKTTSNLGQHRRIHLPMKPFKCEVCDKQFAVRANLLKHQRKTKCKPLSDQPIICTVCNKTFKREFLLRSHLRRHTTEKPYPCEICNVSFKYKSTLMRHIQLHNGVKPFSCKICQKTFTHAGLIKPHMRKHTGEKPYPCPICKKMFAHKHNMERHTLRHNKVKNLECVICNKRFPKESRLRYHMRIHTNEKPFVCKLCPKKFSHKQNVIRHYSRKHPGNVFDCEITDASFARDVWDSVIQKKEKLELPPIESGESNDEYVIP